MTPSPSATNTPTFTPVPTSTSTPTFTPTTTPTPTATDTPTMTPSPSATNTPKPTTGLIQGQIHAGGTPIVKAKVTLRNMAFKVDDAGFNVAETTTDAQGRYSFAGVKSGTYSLLVWYEMAAPQDSPCSITPNSAVISSSWMYMLMPLKAGGYVLIAGQTQGFPVAAGQEAEHNVNLAACR
jgi:hypothetical protein